MKNTQNPIVIKALLAPPAILLFFACSPEEQCGPKSHSICFAPPPPMQCEFPGLGSFGAYGYLSVVESFRNANLSVRGEAYPVKMGLGLSMPPTQSRTFAAGERVEFDGTSGVIYGLADGDLVSQPIRAVQMTLTDSGTATLEFELGDEVFRNDQAPDDLGPVDRFWVLGELGVSCSPVAPGMMIEDDPRMESEFCQQAIPEFGLEELARYDLQRRYSK